MTENLMQNTLHETPSRILVIDDNPAIHEDFRKILVSENGSADLADAEAAFFGDEAVSDTGFQLNVELDSAYQGKEGFQFVEQSIQQKRPYAIAFVDMRMPPGWDGLTTIENLWNVDPNLQVVICSAYSDNTWSDISERLGRSDRLLILKKPFDNAEVLQLTVALVEKRRLADQALVKQDELEELVSSRTKNLEKAKKESERLLTAIDSLLVEVDESGTIQCWNQNATQILGIQADDAIGQRVSDLPIAWDDRDMVMSVFGSKCQERSTGNHIVFKDANETQRHLSITCYPIFEESRRNGMLILGMDSTEQFILQQQLQQAQKLESVGQLAAGVAHEINTPMQYLGDNLEYLSSKFSKLIDYLTKVDEITSAADSAGFESERVAEVQAFAKKLKLVRLYQQIPAALEDSMDGVNHVSRIVRAMKELSHPGGEELAPVCINHVIETTITVSTNEWKYVAEVESNLDPDLPPIAGLAGELTQVFLNLIVNAAHAISDMTNKGSDGKGMIRVETSQQGDFVVVSLSDTGGGIPDSIRDRVFDPFFTTKEVGKGTGQGLAIAHAVIVRKHGGRIWFEIEENVGTCFKIELPICAAMNIEEQEDALVSANS